MNDDESNECKIPVLFGVVVGLWCDAQSVKIVDDETNFCVVCLTRAQPKQIADDQKHPFHSVFSAIFVWETKNIGKWLKKHFLIEKFHIFL